MFLYLKGTNVNRILSSLHVGSF